MRAKTVARAILDNKVILIILVLVVLLSIFSPTFRTYENIINVIFQISVNGIIAIGMTFLIIGKDFDLSVGSNLALATTVGVVLQKYGPFVVIISAILASSLAGFVNGILVTRLRLNAFITTLAMMFFLRGLVFYLTDGETVKGITNIYTVFSYGTFLLIPYSAIAFVVMIIIFAILLVRTKWGRHVYAIGGNPLAAIYLGINEKTLRIISFVLTGAFCGFAGIVTMSRINVASGRLGTNTALDVITAVLLGGTLLSGGYGNLFKTFQGVLVLGIIANGMTLLNVQPYVQQVIKGAILIVVIVADSFFRGRGK